MRVCPIILFLFLGTSLIMNAQYNLDGELRKWHKITITFDGPSTSETASPNPFTDYRLIVTFTNSDKTYRVPGYYATDGNAANTGAESGNKWRVHFAPDATGTWEFTASFRTGTNIAVSDSPSAGSPASFDGVSGSFEVAPTNKSGRDHRGKGRLQYVGEHYLQFTETGEYFIKIGADAPENFLAYEDFDNTPNNGLRRKSWEAHIQDWNSGDPTWQSNKGKGMIGALNYLASEGQNAFSFLTMNINGDDKNVFPYISDSAGDRVRFDCSKLDQWEIVFEHADQLGLYLHFKTQETENDQLLDGGALGLQRKMYYRELIARFAHHLALNWNIGEENTNTPQQRREFAQYFHDHDPYNHNIVIHTFPNHADEVYGGLTGNQSQYTGASIQSGWSIVHRYTLQWVENSANSGKKWVVANDEQGNSSIGVPNDGYTGNPTQNDIRKAVLWGNLLAGGAGVEYYFGYQLPHSDLTCQDYRSRDRMWDYNRYAHQFFTTYLPFVEMSNQNGLIGNGNDSNSKYCLAKPGDTYVVYLPTGGSTNLDLQDYPYTYNVRWFNPRSGGNLQTGSLSTVSGPGSVNIGTPPGSPDQDWVALITADSIACPPAGTPCNDGDNSTFNDREDGDCNCEGTPCPPAGTECDDGNPDTIDDQEDGFCNCFGTFPGSDTDVWLEAECASVGNQWTILTDDNASNNRYALPPQETSLNTPPPSEADLITFAFNVATSGSYKVFARTMTTEDGDDSFWVRANGGPWQKWNKINAGNYGSFYQWEQVGNWISGENSDPVEFFLNAGPNIIDFAWREPDARLDKIFITLDGSIPQGIGQEPSEGCNVCPPAGTPCDDNDPATTNDTEDGLCNCEGTPCPPAGTACDDGDPNTFNDQEDGQCNCEGTSCPPAGTACDDGDPATFNDQEDGQCNCEGTPCLPAGTTCDDGDPNTFNDQEDGQCNCEGTPCPPAGTACDDGDPTTNNDTHDGQCNCNGNPCPPSGTECDDGNPDTINDTEDGACNCSGTSCPPAGTECDDEDPTTFNDQEDGQCNCEGTPCPPAGASCDDGDPNTVNDQEDGQCNCSGETTGENSSFWLEAECASVGSRWNITTSQDASNGAYVVPPDEMNRDVPSDTPEDLVQFTVGLSEPGTFIIYARTMSTGDDNNSFWVRANEGQWQRWNKVNNENFDSFQWNRIGNWTGGDNVEPVTFSLNAGTNTIDFAGREPNTLLDKIFVSPADSLPQDQGGEASNCNPVSSVDNNPSLISHFEIFPNPAYEEFVLSYRLVTSKERQGQVYIRNQFGQLARQWKITTGGNGHARFDLAGIPAGTYIVSFRVENEIQHAKLVVIPEQR